uniref:DUF1279 domain-containing protein n=2 Tax=Gossypium TaxID=3633 RepID=A0A0D2SVT2_GOSRA|nr:hypothetical protein B456_006G114200 [Gossypium raimondii]
MATTAVLTLTPLSSTSFLTAHTYSKLSSALTSTSIKPKFRSYQIKAIKEKAEEIQTPPSSSSSSSVDEVTKKYGLEVGLWKIFSSKEEGEQKKSKGDQAKELLAKYGGAYLATSITLSLISFSLCYALISAGVDVQALLQKVN